MGATTTSDAVLVTVVLPGKGNKKGRDKGKKRASLSATASSGELGYEELTEPRIYPNPATANQMVKVDLPDDDTEVKIILHELSTGRKVSDHSYEKDQTVQFDVSTLSDGLFVVTITVEGRVWTKKLILLP